MTEDLCDTQDTSNYCHFVNRLNGSLYSYAVIYLINNKNNLH